MTMFSNLQDNKQSVKGKGKKAESRIKLKPLSSKGSEPDDGGVTSTVKEQAASVKKGVKKTKKAESRIKLKPLSSKGSEPDGGVTSTVKEQAASVKKGVKKTKKILKTRKAKYIIKFLSAGSDISTDIIFFATNVLDPVFQESTGALVVTILAALLMVFNTLFDVFILQYFMGIEHVAAKRISSVLGQHNDDFNKRKAMKSSIKKNPFLDGMFMAFTIISLVMESLPAIALTFIVANGTGNLANVLKPMSLVNIGVSLTVAILQLTNAIRGLLSLAASSTADEMRFSRLSAGKITCANSRITGEVKTGQGIKLALRLLCPTLFLYTKSVVPFAISAFSPKVMLKFVEQHLMMVVQKSHTNSDVGRDETTAAMAKALNEATQNERSFLLRRAPVLTLCKKRGKKKKSQVSPSIP